MIFEASQTPQKFKFDKLRRKRDDEGNPLQMDACTYQVTIPSFTFKSGKVIIRFNKISIYQLVNIPSPFTIVIDYIT